jgi:hypothetical protein
LIFKTAERNEVGYYGRWSDSSVGPSLWLVGAQVSGGYIFLVLTLGLKVSDIILLQNGFFLE